MSKKTNTIEINGKRYDATTGALLEAASSNHVKHLDGVKSAVVQQQTKADAPVRKITVATQPVAAHKPTMSDIKRPKATSAKHHQPESAKTLMRHTVKKPVTQPKSDIKVHTLNRSLKAQPKAVATAKLSIRTIDKTRLQHAKSVSKSKHVSRFNKIIPASHGQFIMPTMPAVAAPRTLEAKLPHQPQHQAKTVESLFQAALDKADAHRQPAYKIAHKHAKRNRRLSRRIMSVSGVAFAFVLVAGAITYQSMDQLTLMHASAKAGFAASLPTKHPAGYSLANFEYKTGSVALNYRSNSNDDRTFKISEKPSLWDSNTLRDRYVTSVASNYQAIETAGLTIFMYDEGNATWVNNGLQYAIHSQDSLSNKQLAEIATSL